MECTTAISSIENTIKRLHINSPLYFVYPKNLYHDKQEIMDELFHQYHLFLLIYIDHPVLITEWKQNIDSSDYDFFGTKE